MGLELSLDRVWKILDYNKISPHTAMETGKVLDIPEATIHRMFRMLIKKGWLIQDGKKWLPPGNHSRTLKIYRSAVIIQRLEV